MKILRNILGHGFPVLWILKKSGNVLGFRVRKKSKLKTMSCRFNPGGYFKMSNGIMDNPGDSKYGMTEEQITEAFRIMKSKGLSLELISECTGLTTEEIEKLE